MGVYDNFDLSDISPYWNQNLDDLQMLLTISTRSEIEFTSYNKIDVSENV